MPVDSAKVRGCINLCNEFRTIYLSGLSSLCLFIDKIGPWAKVSLGVLW